MDTLKTSVITGPDASELDPECCWRDVVARNISPNPRFFTAVRSTGIYCVPSCPSRTPKRENVSFFPTPDAAEAAGYRACLRCRPREAGARVKAVTAACRYIEETFDGPISLALLSEQVGLSPQHLHRTFKRMVGVTPRDYAAAFRARRFKNGLAEGQSVTDATFDAGFGSASRLYESVEAELGMLPKQYKNGGNMLTVTFATAPTDLGCLLVAVTERGICAVMLGDSDEALEVRLRREYPAANVIRDNEILYNKLQTVFGLLNGKAPDPDLPIDVRATAFQRRVWAELRRIPFGQTRTYAQVADAIGQPSAVRAVASACAANQVALIVPCHRVVRTDGGFGGYRWGEERKRALLEREFELSIDPARSAE